MHPRRKTPHPSALEAVRVHALSHNKGRGTVLGITEDYPCFPAIISCNVATCLANAPRPAAVAGITVTNFQSQRG
ncbi:hypothetical protein ABIC09_003958 [Bradyrhizobium sp. S3.12.5]